MSHLQQRQFCQKTKARFPKNFWNKRVLDVGSLDINGNNRFLFEDCDYTGIDLGVGPNVDIICPIHLFEAMPFDTMPFDTMPFDTMPFDTIISTEAFEHDPYFEESLKNIVRLLKPEGLFLFTCAAKGRPEHGTIIHNPKDSPFTNDYYKTISGDDVRAAINIDLFFSQYRFDFCLNPRDLYFWGVKKKIL